MLKQILKQASLATVASGVVSAKIPTFGTHHALFLVLNASSGTLTRANAIADITNIVVRINGDQIIDATAQILLDIQRYYMDSNSGLVSTNCTAEVFTVASNVIVPIYFDRRDLATDQQRSLFALGMKDVSSFTVDITCGASVNSANHVGTIDIFSQVSPVENPLGQHIRIQRFPQSLSTATTVEIATLPKEPTTGYLALHLYHATVAIDSATVKIGGRAVWDQVPIDLAKVVALPAGRSFQVASNVGYHVIDFALSQDVLRLGFLPMLGVQDFRVTPVFHADPSAGSLTIIAERVFGLNISGK